MNKTIIWKLMAIICFCWTAQATVFAMDITKQEYPPYSVVGSLSQAMIDPLPRLNEIRSDLYKVKLELSQETIYELVSSQDGLGWSFAIADIIQSEPHFHRYTSETYTIVTGVLEVIIDGKSYVFHPGDVVVIPLGAVHWARSLTNEPARILVSCIPGWTQEDHIPVKK